MPSAPGGLGEFNAGSIRRNHFCMGVKRGKKYVCGGDANEDAINNAVDLLIEAVNRIQRWRVWDSWWIKEIISKWLEKRDRLEQQLKNKYGKDVVSIITGLVDKFINYNEQLLNYWREVGGEVKRLIEDLLNGRAEVIIWSNEEGVSVYYGCATLKIERTRTGGIIVQLSLKGLGGVTIRVPDVFKKTMSREEYRRFIKKVLRALRGGLEEADGTIKDGKAAMGTAQIWQVIVWLLLYPGKAHVLVDTINVNENDVTMTYYLRSSHEPLKGKILNNADKLGEEELLAFMLGVVLGDGYADVEKLKINGRAYDEAVVKITMSGEELDAWKPLLMRLRSMGFNWRPVPIGDGAVDVRFYGGNAIDLARAMINVLPSVLKDVFNALDFEKWINLRRIAEIKMKWRRGEAQINVAGYGFTVDVHKNTVWLKHKVKGDAEVKMVVDALRVRYGDGFAVNIHKSGRYRVVAIPMCMIEKYEDIKEKVIEVLCRKLEKTKNEEKRQIIIKHLKQLAPTEGAAAADYPEGFIQDQAQIKGHR